MAKGLTASKAKKILEDGTVRGKALTEKQKKFFGAVAGGATPLKAIDGAGVPKAQIGLVNKLYKLYKGSKKFESSIDWKKWVKYTDDFDNNPDVIKHLNEIEETTKANGTWMKNPDGSAFKGTQEEFVIQQSDNFKKAFPNPVVDDAGNPLINYHGSGSKFDVFDESKFYSGTYGKGVYTSPNKDAIVKSYANPNKNRTKKIADESGTDEATQNLYELYINSKNPLTTDDILDFRNFGKTVDELPSLKDWKNSDFGKKMLAENTYLKTDDDIISFIRMNTPKNPVKESLIDQGGDFLRAVDTPLQEGVTPFWNQMKSAKGNILFDMNNPNIYKAIVPGAIGTAAASQMTGPVQEDGQFKNGGWLDKFGMGGSLPGASGMMYSRNSDSSAMSPPNLTKAQDGTVEYETVEYGTPEYKKAYEEGTFAHVPNQLDEVVTYSGVDYEKYPYYNDLSAEQRKYFDDDGPIGRGVRRAAYTKRGLAEDTYDVVNPIMYGALGLAGGMAFAPQLATLGRAAAGPIGRALSYKPLGGPVSVSNIMDAYFAKEAIQNTPQAYRQYKENPSFDTGLDLGLTAMDMIPFGEIFTGFKGTKNLYNKGKNLFTKTPTPAVSNTIDASVDPGIRKGLANLNNKLGIVNTTSSQIRASEKFNKNWFNHPDIIKRTEQMINQPSKVRANMSEVEILQDINMYNTMLDKTPNLPAKLQTRIRENLKDLNAGLANKNLQTVQQKGRFTEVFDESNLKHQDMALHYDENPETLGLYKGRTNQASINVERIKEKARDVGSVITHEDLHAITAGKSGYTDEAKDILNSAVGKDQDWWLNKINTTKDQKKRAELIDRLEYLARPQEIHARVHELRKAFNLKPGQEVSLSKIEAMMTKGLKGETPVDEAFFRLLGDKENFRKIFNKLPAYIPAAVGLGAASQNKNGGNTPKAQVGEKVAAIASQMEANEEDGGRPPASFDSVESLGGLKRYMQDVFNSSIDEDGLCRDNTCVETVKDFYSKAGINAIPQDVYNNREFLKNFKEYGFEEVLDQKNLQPGDVLQYYYGPDSEDVKEDPSYLNFPYHMGVYVNPGEYIGDGDNKAPIQRKNMYTGIKDGKEYKKDPFRAFRYIKQNKNGGGVPKAQYGLLKKLYKWYKGTDKVTNAANTTGKVKYLDELSFDAKKDIRELNYKVQSATDKETRKLGKPHVAQEEYGEGWKYSDEVNFNNPEEVAAHRKRWIDSQKKGNFLYQNRSFPLFDETSDIYTALSRKDLSEAIRNGLSKPFGTVGNSYRTGYGHIGLDYKTNYLNDYFSNYNVTLPNGTVVPYGKLDGDMTISPDGFNSSDEAMGQLRENVQKYLGTQFNTQFEKPSRIDFGDLLKNKNRNGGWLSKYENGGVIEDDRGQWAHPGEVTKINSNNITMKGVNYPVLGVSDTGDKKMMQPGKDYKFDGNSVTEYPMAKDGKSLVALDQLTNFTNYNTPQPGGWLDKY